MKQVTGIRYHIQVEESESRRYKDGRSSYLILLIAYTFMVALGGLFSSEIPSNIERLLYENELGGGFIVLFFRSAQTIQLYLLLR